MDSILFKWLLDLVSWFAEFGNWLTTPLIGVFSPLTIFSFSGISLIIGLLIINLFNITHV